MAEKELDKRNFENLVWFYQNELESLNEGKRAGELFPKGLRRRLLDLGVIVYKKGRAEFKYMLSSAAMALLSSMPPKYS